MKRIFFSTLFSIYAFFLMISLIQSFGNPEMMPIPFITICTMTLSATLFAPNALSTHLCAIIVSGIASWILRNKKDV